MTHETSVREPQLAPPTAGHVRTRPPAADPTASSPGDHTGAARVTLDTHFQPIAAVRRGTVLGIEALTRARRSDGTPVPPLALFEAAEREGTVDALDRDCRRVAVQRFAPLHRAHPTLVCFVNCRVTTFLADVAGAHAWSALVRDEGVDPRTIALEVLESQSANLDALAAATAAYREAGFLVVIDDVGAGHSNLDRIAAVRPDLLKADGSLVQGCARDRVKRAVLRALVGLTEELGGWLVVEGVEREDDALTVLDLGADLLQGFHLARPGPLNSLAGLEEPRRRTVELADMHRASTRTRVLRARTLREHRARFACTAARALAEVPPDAWDAALASALASAPGDARAATAMVVDETGLQLTPTLRSTSADAPERSLIFHAPEAGTDHAMKEYVYLLPPAPEATYESLPYVPMPNEKLCVTVSTAFADVTGARRLLCVHLDAELDNSPLDASPPADSLGR